MKKEGRKEGRREDVSSPTMWFTLIGVTVVEPLKLVEGGGSSGGGGVADDAVDARLNRVDAFFDKIYVRTFVSL